MGLMKTKALEQPAFSLAPDRCEAVQVSDQMNCRRCGLVWDMNDPSPPECIVDPVAAQHAGLTAILEDRRRHAVEGMAAHRDEPENLAYWRGMRQAYTVALSLLEKYG